MTKAAIIKTFKGFETALKKHTPEILTGIGIAGFGTAIVLGVRATPKALMLIEEEKHRQNLALRKEAEKKGEEVAQYIDTLPPIEVIKTAWACYIPTVVVAALSATCLIGASSVNLRRNAALATAYALSESAMKEYQEKVLEEVGPKKEEAVRDAVAKKHLEEAEKTHVTSTREVILTERGNTLCLDSVSRRFFKSDIEFLRKVENELNRRMRDEMWVSLNDFYREIDLEESAIGDDIGWNIDRGYIQLEFSSQLTSEGTPCLVVNYALAPNYDYR